LSTRRHDWTKSSAVSGVPSRPASVGAEVKGPGEGVSGDAPALGDAGNRLRGFLVEGREALEEGDGDVLIGRGGDELGVEVLGLGAVAEVQNAIAVAGGDAGFAGTAAGEEQGGDKE